jgi:hypothetical protein
MHGTYECIQPWPNSTAYQRAVVGSTARLKNPADTRTQKPAASNARAASACAVQEFGAECMQFAMLWVRRWSVAAWGHCWLPVGGSPAPAPEAQCSTSCCSRCTHDGCPVWHPNLTCSFRCAHTTLHACAMVTAKQHQLAHTSCICEISEWHSTSVGQISQVSAAAESHRPSICS